MSDNESQIIPSTEQKFDLSAFLNKEVTVEDTGEVITVTDDLQKDAMRWMGFIEGGFWQLAIGLAKFKTNSLYAAFGFTTFKGFCQEVLPFGVRQAYNYALVGEKFGFELTDGDSGMKSTAHSLSRLGIRKLKLLSEQGEEQIMKLIRTGKIKVGEDILTSEELQNQTIVALRARAKFAEEESEKHKEKAQKAELLEEKLKFAEKEKEELEEFKNRNITKVEKAEEIEADIEEGFKAISDYMRIMNRICLEDAPEHLVKKYYDLLEVSRGLHERFFDRNAAYLMELDAVKPPWMDEDSLLQTHIE